MVMLRSLSPFTLFIPWGGRWGEEPRETLSQSHPKLSPHGDSKSNQGEDED